MKTNKTRKYNIYCDFDNNAKAQRFATKHAFEKTVVEVRSIKRWFRADPRVNVTFKSNERRTDIYRSFIEEFKEYDLEIEGTCMFVYRKKEEAL